MKTVLVTAPIEKKNRYTTGLEKISNIKPPVGLAYLAASMKKNDLPVEMIDAEALGLNVDQLVEKIKESGAQIVGITCLTMAYNLCRQVARKLKEVTPSCLVVVGGPHASIFKEKILDEEPAIDVVAIGEGDNTIVELVETHKRAQGLDKVAGIALRKNGNIILTAPRELEKDLDQFSYPAWEMLPFERYSISPQWAKFIPLVTIVGSRGCPFPCTFCSNGVFGRSVRKRSPESVVAEMKHFKTKLGCKAVFFGDDIFTLDRKWVIELCELMVAEKVDLPWACESRVDTVGRDLLQLMARAGCWNIFYGIESGNQEILDTLKKGITLDQIRQAVKWTKEAGIEIQSAFMLALPGETPEKAMETIRFAIELDCDYAKFNITAPFAGTELFDQAREEEGGVVHENIDQYTTQHPVFIPAGYKDQEEILEMKRKAFRMFYLRPRYILRKISQIRSFDDIFRYMKAAKGYSAIIRGA